MNIENVTTLAEKMREEMNEFVSVMIENRNVKMPIELSRIAAQTTYFLMKFAELDLAIRELNLKLFPLD